MLLLASLVVLDAERGREGASIEDIGDALWWSATTVTTVGYGDHFPVTGTGRVVATRSAAFSIARGLGGEAHVRAGTARH